MRRHLLRILCIASTLALSADSRAVSELARKHIVEIEKLLPDAEAAADACEQALAPLLTSKDPVVVLAVENALLRIDCIRSIRKIIEKSPDFCAYGLHAGRVTELQESLDYYLDCAKKATDPFAGLTSGVRCFRSPVDGQLLFYVFRLPRDYDAKKTYPMDVALHAGSGLTWKVGWVTGKPSNDPRKANAEERITISPCGRGNNCYAVMGETAVYDAIDDAKKHYAVDADRVTIGGASMGGTGAFRLIAYRPDVFAAGSSLTGGAYYGVPKGDGRWDATMLTDNFANVGFVILDAPQEGHYKDNHAFAELLREHAKEYPGFYPNLELTDPVGGHGVIDRKLRAEGEAWVRKQLRRREPNVVVYKTYSLRYDGAYWVKIDMVEDPTKPARIEARFTPPNRVDVVTENVARFHGDPFRAQVYDVRVDAANALRLSPGRHRIFAKVDGKWTLVSDRYPQGLVKKHGLSGPVVDVFMEHPVLMVYGTLEKKDAAAQNAMIDAVIQNWLGDGDGAQTLHTAFERRADVDVTEDDIKGKNLVLFGSSAQNALVAKIAEGLPVKFVAGGVDVGGKTTKGELLMVYPNPLNPERYVLIVPEGCGRINLKGFDDWAVGVTQPGYKGVDFRPSVHGTFDS
ncbi:MAG TPA: hypothetical protein VMX57_05095, partial [Planctomycetota bacterium]|nr:hypothetical protein [Planctomycetota bacterium]